MNSMSALKDGFQVFFWNTTPGNDMLTDYLKECDSQVLFYGNRTRKRGEDAEKAWFEQFYVLFTAITKFLSDRKETICDWTGTQDGAGAKAFFESQQSGASS